MTKIMTDTGWVYVVIVLDWYTNEDSRTLLRKTGKNGRMARSS